MSMLGVLSIIILIPCVYAMISHHKLITLRGDVDDVISALEELQFEAEEEYIKNPDVENPEENIEIAEKINLMKTDLAEKLEKYNIYVSKFPGSIVAAMVGLKREE